MPVIRMEDSSAFKVEDRKMAEHAADPTTSGFMQGHQFKNPIFDEEKGDPGELMYSFFPIAAQEMHATDPQKLSNTITNEYISTSK